MTNAFSSGHLAAWAQPSVWDTPCAANPGAQPRAAAPVQAPPPAPAALAGDQWDALSVFAARADAAASIEREIGQCFERRALLARRLTDASKRRDEGMATQSAKDWITSEVRLAKLFEAYQSFMDERTNTLRKIGAAV